MLDGTRENHLDCHHNYRVCFVILGWLLIANRAHADGGVTKSVWKAAAAVWHLDSEKEAAGSNPLIVKGAVFLAFAG